MSEIINLPITETSKSISSSAVKGGAAGLKEGGALELANPASENNSFKDSMSKVSEEATSNNQALPSEEDGNELPLLANLESEPEPGDRLQTDEIVIPGLSLENTGKANNNVNEELKIETKLRQTSPDIELNKQNSTLSESIVKGDVKAELLSSPIRQLLQSASKDNSTQKADISGNRISSSTESTLLRHSEMPLMKIDGIEMMNQKSLMSGQSSIINSTELASQLQTSTEQQSSLLSRFTVNTDSNLNILPSTINTATTSLSSPVLQPLSQAEITEQFGRTNWSQGMGKQIVWLANQSIKSAEIRLNPAHLGPVEIKLDVVDDQINVALSSRHAAVREAMELALPKLREMLEENGLNLTDADITEHSFAQQQEQDSEHVDNRKFASRNEQIDSQQIDNAHISQVQVSDAMVDYYI